MRTKFLSLVSTLLADFSPPSSALRIAMTKSVLLLALGSLLAQLVPSVRAQTLLSQTFESMSVGSLPTGWVFNPDPNWFTPQPSAEVQNNPLVAGLNTSAKVAAVWGNNASYQIATLNIASAVTAGATFTFGFDLYIPSGSGDAFIVGFGINNTNNGPADWSIATPGTSGQAPTHTYSYNTGASAWQHFSFDITSLVATRLQPGGGATPSSFAVFVESVDSGPLNVYADNLTLSASAIPEPSTYAAMAGAALLGFVVWRRRAAVIRVQPAATC
jgi:hypothetical protein